MTHGSGWARGTSCAHSLFPPLLLPGTRRKLRLLSEFVFAKPAAILFAQSDSTF